MSSILDEMMCAMQQRIACRDYLDVILTQFHELADDPDRWDALTQEQKDEAVATYELLDRVNEDNETQISFLEHDINLWSGPPFPVYATRE